MKSEKEIRELRDSLAYMTSSGPIGPDHDAWAHAYSQREILSWVLGELEEHQPEVDALNEAAAFERHLG